MGYFKETEKNTIIERNKRSMTEHNKKIKRHRNAIEDRRMARELGLTLDEISQALAQSEERQ